MTTNQPSPLRDYGAFGPDSVTWRVCGYPTTLTVAFLRTGATEILEPFVLASIEDTQSIMTRPLLRYDRTLQYTATLIFGDSTAACRASDTLMRVHRHIRGREPISGLPYDALDPASQLWIHLTQWHSVLYMYERFGPGPLSREDDERYWAECRQAAIYQTFDPEDVPRNRAEMTAYYERMKPRLVGSEAAQRTFNAIINSANINHDFPRGMRPVLAVMTPFLRAAALATLPRWLRRVGGTEQSRMTDTLITMLARPFFALLARSPRLQIKMINGLSPRSVPVLAPALLGVPPLNPQVVPPADAWAAADRPTPREQYLAMREARLQTTPQAAPRDDPWTHLPFAG
jgi:uncharacterized protein (DUF2236 family)